MLNNGSSAKVSVMSSGPYNSQDLVLFVVHKFYWQDSKRNMLLPIKPQDIGQPADGFTQQIQFCKL